MSHLIFSASEAAHGPVVPVEKVAAVGSLDLRCDPSREDQRAGKRGEEEIGGNDIPAKISYSLRGRASPPPKYKRTAAIVSWRPEVGSLCCAGFVPPVSVEFGHLPA